MYKVKGYTYEGCDVVFQEDGEAGCSDVWCLTHDTYVGSVASELVDMVVEKPSTNEARFRGFVELMVVRHQERVAEARALTESLTRG